MSANTVTEELKASLLTSIHRHGAFPEQERNTLQQINTFLGMAATLRSLLPGIGGHTSLGLEISKFSEVMSTQAQGMSAIIQRMRTNLISISSKVLESGLDDLQRGPIGVEMPDLYTTQTALGLVSESDNLNNQLTTMSFGSMAYDQQVMKYEEEVHPRTGAVVKTGLYISRVMKPLTLAQPFRTVL